MANNGQSTATGTGTGLTGPVYPRFFAGQLLTDRDLTALEEWARARLGLARFRDGWGVACGLGLRPARGKPGRLTVTPGYALDRCGNDLVLAADTDADIPPPGHRNGAPCPVPPAPFADTGEAFTAGPWDGLPLSRMAVFDLLIRYDTRDAVPVAALADKGSQRCEYSRTQEAGKLVFVTRSWEEAGVRTAPGAAPAPVDPAVRLLGDFHDDATVNAIFAAQLPSPGTPTDVPDRAAAVQVWLTARLDKDPALSGTFPTLRDWVAEHGATEFRTYWSVARVLFWIADAARRTGRTCAGCGDGAEDGVPLARVWAELDGGAYKIRFVDDTPPYRRPLGEPADDPWDPRTYRGRRRDDVARALAAVGVAAATESLETPADADHLLRLLNEEAEGDGPLLAPGQSVVAVTSRRAHDVPGAKEPPRPEPFAERVAAFRRPTVAPPRAPVTTSTTTLDVRAYRPTSGAEVAPAFAAKPADDQAFQGGALPTGGFVTLAATLNDADLTAGSAGKSFVVYWHDDLRNQVFHVGAPAANAVVVTLQIPSNTTPRDSVRVTLLVRESVGARERLLAVSGPVTGLAGGTKAVPLSVVANDFKMTPLTLKVVPLVGSGNDAVVLQGGAVPVTLKMANPSPSAVKGSLRFSKTKPTDLVHDGALVGTVAQAAKTKLGDVLSGTGLVGPVASITPDVGATEVYFWLTDGTDEFQRPFAIGPGDIPQLRLVPVAIDVAVKNVDESVGGAKKPQLILTSKDATKTIEVTKLSVAPGDDPGTKTDLALPMIGNPIAPNAALAPIDMPKPIQTVWRVWIEMKIDSAKLSGAIDVTATT